MVIADLQFHSRRDRQALQILARACDKVKSPDAIRTYCYNGHAGQLTSTALGLLGYDVANMAYGMMAWSEDDEVLGMDRYDPKTSPDYPVEGTAVEAPAAEEAAPETVPETGGAAFPVEGILLGFGALTAVAGLYLRRRNTT